MGTTVNLTSSQEVPMRGDDRQQAAIFSYISPEQRVPAERSLRPMRDVVDQVLRGLSSQFDAL
jgi:hypothetical protein